MEAKHAEIFGYCVRCRKKQPIKNPEKIVTKGNRPAVKGTCSVCSTRMIRMGVTR